MDGVYTPCDMAMRAFRSEGAVQCPDNNCGPRTRYFTNSEGETRGILTTPFMAFANGISGYFYPTGMELGTPQAQADWYAQIFRLAERGEIPSELGGVLDGRVSFSSLDYRKMTEPEVNNLREQLVDALAVKNLPNGKTCNDFLTATLRHLRAPKIFRNNIMRMFERYANSKRGFRDGSIGFASTVSTANSSKPEIVFDLKGTQRDIGRGINGSGRPAGRDELVLTLIHEMLHGAGNKTPLFHPQMALGMYRSGLELGFLKEADKPSGKDDTDTFNKIEDWIKKACGRSR